MLKLDSTVHRLDSDIASKSCQRGRCKGRFWRACEEKRRLSGFRRRWPPEQSWQAPLQQLSFGPNFLCTDTSAASCGINTLAERTRCPPLSSKKVIQGGPWKAHRVCDPGQVLTASTVAGMWHLIPADFCFYRLTATAVCIPNTHPAPLPSTCFISCNRHLPLHILWRGGLGDRGVLHHQQMLLCTSSFHKLAPLQKFGGSVY